MYLAGVYARRVEEFPYLNPSEPLHALPVPVDSPPQSLPHTNQQIETENLIAPDVEGTHSAGVTFISENQRG